MIKNEILALIIPIYYEEKNIPDLLDEISKKIKIPIKLYFVYDLEEDPTLVVLKSSLKKYNLNFSLIKNIYGRGALNAIRTGIEIFEEEACVIVMGDCSDDLSSINGMYGLFCQGFHLVCASRYMRNGKQIGGSAVKRLLSYTAGISLYLLTSIPTHDPTNSFKLYSKKLTKKISIESKGGFEVGLEILTKAHILNFSISEVPTIWKDRYEGTSKFKLFRWMPNYLKWYFILLLKKPFFLRRKKIIYNEIRPVGY